MTPLLSAIGGSDIEVTETLIVGLMLIAALVGIAVSRLRLPYTVALVLVGLALGVGGAFTEIDLTSDLILLVFLPPLLFEGSINMNLDDLVRRWRQVATLALAGMAVSAAVIAAISVVVPGMPVEYAVVLAVILAPTDPVSVLAVFKGNGVVSGLRTLMEGESIFNDAIAIVAYLIAVEVAFGTDTVTAQDALREFGVEVAVGVGVGAAVGFAVHRLMSTLDDHLVEITLSLVTAYGSHLIADRLGGSGVIAVVAAGLLIVNLGTRFAMSASSRVTLSEFCEVLAFLANSARSPWCSPWCCSHSSSRGSPTSRCSTGRASPRRPTSSPATSGSWPSRWRSPRPATSWRAYADRARSHRRCSNSSTRTSPNGCGRPRPSWSG